MSQFNLSLMIPFILSERKKVHNFLKNLASVSFEVLPYPKSVKKN